MPMSRKRFCIVGKKNNESVLKFYQVPYFIFISKSACLSYETCLFIQQTQPLAANERIGGILFPNPHKFFM